MPVKKVLKKAMFQISERDFLPWGIAIHYMKSIDLSVLLQRFS